MQNRRCLADCTNQYKWIKNKLSMGRNIVMIIAYDRCGGILLHMGTNTSELLAMFPVLTALEGCGSQCAMSWSEPPTTNFANLRKLRLLFDIGWWVIKEIQIHGIAEIKIEINYSDICQSSA